MSSSQKSIITTKKQRQSLSSLSQTEVNVLVLAPTELEFSLLDKNLNCRLIQSGLGKSRTAANLAVAMQDRPDAVLLTGFVGGIRKVAKGDAIEVTMAVEADYDASPIDCDIPMEVSPHSKLFGHVPGAVCLTQSRFVKDYRRVGFMSLEGPVVCDMEAYTVMHMCRQFEVPVHVMKIVSDLANVEAPDDFLDCGRFEKDLVRMVIESVKIMKERYAKV